MQKFVNILLNFGKILTGSTGPAPWGQGRSSLLICKDRWQERKLRENTITHARARSRLDQRRFSRPNTHFSAFFKIYKNIIFSQTNLQNFCKISQNFAKKKKPRNFWKNSASLQDFAHFVKFRRIVYRILQNLVDFERR